MLSLAWNSPLLATFALLVACSDPYSTVDQKSFPDFFPIVSSEVTESHIIHATADITNEFDFALCANFGVGPYIYLTPRGISGALFLMPSNFQPQEPDELFRSISITKKRIQPGETARLDFSFDYNYFKVFPTYKNNKGTGGFLAKSGSYDYEIVIYARKCGTRKENLILHSTAVENLYLEFPELSETHLTVF